MLKPPQSPKEYLVEPSLPLSSLPPWSLPPSSLPLHPYPLYPSVIFPLVSHYRTIRPSILTISVIKSRNPKIRNCICAIQSGQWLIINHQMSDYWWWGNLEVSSHLCYQTGLPYSCQSPDIRSSPRHWESCDADQVLKSVVIWVTWIVNDRWALLSQTGIFHDLFTLFLWPLTLISSFKFSAYSHTYICCYQFCLLTLFKTIKKTKNAVYWGLNATKEHYNYNGRPVYKCVTMKTTGCLLRQNDRTRHPLQDRWIGMIAHQRADQGVPFQGVHPLGTNTSFLIQDIVNTL